MSLPSFICVGAPKAATTWLYSCLRDHPEIFIPSYKEMHFFIPYAGRDLLREKGLEWYRAFYASATAFPVRGEIQTQYLAHELAPSRIARAIPDCKIVVMLRNPVDRLWSHLHYDLNRSPHKKHTSVSELLRDPWRLKQTEHGFYARHLQRYLRHFDRRQIHVVTAEEVQASGDSAVAGILRFIGAKTDVSLPATTVPKNEARDIKHPRLYRLMHGLWGKLAPSGLDRLRVLAKRTGVPEQVKRWNSKTAPNPKLGAGHRAALIEVYRDDIRELERMLGRSFAPWYAAP